LGNLSEMLFTFLTEVKGLAAPAAAEALWDDYRRAGRSDRPAFLRPWIGQTPVGRSIRVARGVGQRQARHRGTVEERHS
jgi:hypothetical protein